MINLKYYFILVILIFFVTCTKNNTNIDANLSKPESKIVANTRSNSNFLILDDMYGINTQEKGLELRESIGMFFASKNSPKLQKYFPSIGGEFCLQFCPI